MRTRIPLAALAAALALAAFPAAGAEPIDLQWDWLVPGGRSGDEASVPRGVVEHGQLSADDAGSATYDVVRDYNGQTIRLPGYLVPLDLSAAGGKEFLLVPYFGACIHVPPPPPNQIVYVTTEDAYVMEALFEPVYVTGEFDTVMLSTGLADTAYSLSAETIEAYVYD